MCSPSFPQREFSCQLRDFSPVAEQYNSIVDQIRLFGLLGAFDLLCKTATCHCACEIDKLDSILEGCLPGGSDLIRICLQNHEGHLGDIRMASAVCIDVVRKT